MDAGKLNTRITIKRFTEASDGYGGTTTETVDVKTIWASKKETGGEVKTQDGRRLLHNVIEVEVRKKTAEDILFDDLLQVESQTETYRIIELFDSKQDFATTIKAVKII
jgi:head-tail adaptor